jgi:cytochrome c oxidase subunit 2
MAFVFLLFALIVFLMLYFVIRYRRSRNPRATEIPGNWALELVWMLAAAALFLTMFFYGMTGFKALHTVPADALPVKVTARQWSWLFEYQNGRKSTDLVVPQGRAVGLEMRSADVIHSFYAPAYRVKQDVVPGMTTRAWFRAEKLGSSDILCAEYCGLQHSKMLSRVIVVAPTEFEDWLAGKEVSIPELAGGDANTPVMLLREHGCLDCHSLDGKRLVGPTFAGLYGSSVVVVTGGAQRTVTADDEYLRKSILEPGADVVAGYQAIMPAAAAKDRLTDEQIHEVVEYLKTLR